MKIKPATIVKIAVSLILLTLIFTRLDLRQIGAQLQKFSLEFIIFALLYYTGCQLLSCVRWQIILRATGHFVHIHTLLSNYFAGMFVSIFLPGISGGDVYRAYQIGRKIKDTEVALASVFLERFTGLVAVFGLALLGLPPVFKIIGKWDIILLFVAALAIISGAFALIISPQLLIWAEPWLAKFKLSNIATRIAKIQIILRKFIWHRQALALAMGLSLIIVLGNIYFQYLLAQRLNINISFLELMVFVPISIVVCLLPISFGGLGVQEGLWAYLYTSIGLRAEQGVALSLSFTVFGWILSLPGAIIIALDSAGFKALKGEKEN